MRYKLLVLFLPPYKNKKTRRWDEETWPRQWSNQMPEPWVKLVC
jgi:hypothetical protein